MFSHGVEFSRRHGNPCSTFPRLRIRLVLSETEGARYGG